LTPRQAARLALEPRHGPPLVRPPLPVYLQVEQRAGGVLRPASSPYALNTGADLPAGFYRRPRWRVRRRSLPGSGFAAGAPTRRPGSEAAGRHGNAAVPCRAIPPSPVAVVQMRVLRRDRPRAAGRQKAGYGARRTWTVASARQAPGSRPSARVAAERDRTRERERLAGYSASPPCPWMERTGRRWHHRHMASLQSGCAGGRGQPGPWAREREARQAGRASEARPYLEPAPAPHVRHGAVEAVRAAAPGARRTVTWGTRCTDIVDVRYVWIALLFPRPATRVGMKTVTENLVYRGSFSRFYRCFKENGNDNGN